jgi:hypothetical protein
MGWVPVKDLIRCKMLTSCESIHSTRREQAHFLNRCHYVDLSKSPLQIWCEAGVAVAICGSCYQQFKFLGGQLRIQLHLPVQKACWSDSREGVPRFLGRSNVRNEQGFGFLFSSVIGPQSRRPRNEPPYRININLKRALCILTSMSTLAKISSIATVAVRAAAAELGGATCRSRL